MEKKGCTWPGDDALMLRYHDEEWGIPQHDDRKLFEFLVLDAFQAGLSWRTVLYKRDAFRKAFAQFDYKKVAQFGEYEEEELVQNAGIIRNRIKIKGSIWNAQRFMEIRQEFGSFDRYIWQFTKGKTLHGKRKTSAEIPATSSESDAMSTDLKKRDFKFVGSTICYAFMQAAGMVNDHLTSCYCYKKQ